MVSSTLTLQEDISSAITMIFYRRKYFDNLNIRFNGQVSLLAHKKNKRYLCYFNKKSNTDVVETAKTPCSRLQCRGIEHKLRDSAELVCDLARVCWYYN